MADHDCTLKLKVIVELPEGESSVPEDAEVCEVMNRMMTFPAVIEVGGKKHRVVSAELTDDTAT